jgi:hypothetical protein
MMSRKDEKDQKQSTRKSPSKKLKIKSDAFMSFAEQESTKGIEQQPIKIKNDAFMSFAVHDSSKGSEQQQIEGSTPVVT